MLLERSWRIMLGMHASRKLHSRDYEATVEALNGLQSNAEYLRKTRGQMLPASATHVNTIGRMNNFFLRSGLNYDELDKLSIIHVSGTKGKGSTCAYCESILRQHGYRTGFFSSPHLVKVIERIQINGSPVKTEVFSKYFWEVYNNLKSNKIDGMTEMPIYFQMLTLVAFRIFLAEKVDVAIVEVGIGGQYDPTNIIRKSSVVGITSLGYDHTSLLGETLESIAWHKAGIIKKDCRLFTVPQNDEALKVLQKRAAENECKLEIVGDTTNGYSNDLKVPHSIYHLNVSLATAMARAWICKNGNSDQFSAESTRLGLLGSSWPGRFQTLHQFNINYYLDGAHTEESIEYCLGWYMQKVEESSNKKALLFNSTGDRNSEKQLKILHRFGFDRVFFAPNTPTAIKSPDAVNFNVPENQQLIKCAKHKNIWLDLNDSDDAKRKDQTVGVVPTISDVLEALDDGNQYDLLVTGSLHLVGSALSIVDPDLNGRQNVVGESGDDRGDDVILHSKKN